MTAFWLQVLAEFTASLPVFGLGLWFSHRRLRRHVDNVTAAQTGEVRGITAAQTEQLTAHLRRVTAEQTAELTERPRT